MMHVELLILNPWDNPGVMPQLEMVPVVTGLLLVTTPMVSITVLGEKTTVGLAMRIVRFKVPVPEPVLFDAVTV